MKTKNEKARLEGEIQEWKGRRKEEYVQYVRPRQSAHVNVLMYMYVEQLQTERDREKKLRKEKTYDEIVKVIKEEK